MIPIIQCIQQLARRYKDDQVSAMSTKLTFFIILSALPFMICILEVVRRTQITSSWLFDTLTDFIPRVVLEFTQYMFTDIETHTSDGLLPFSIIVAVWSASRGLSTLIQSLNRAYRVSEARNFVVIRIISFFYTLGFIIVLAFTGSLIVFGSRIVAYILPFLPITKEFTLFINIARYIFAIVISMLFFVGLYNITPNMKNSFKAVLPGTLFTTLGFMVISVLFSFYVNYSKSLSYLYGSLSNMVLVLLWLYVCSNIIIIGGELNAILWEKDSSSR